MVIAWFKIDNGIAWIKPGAVPAYFAGVGSPKTTGKGTFESLIELPDGGTASLVPVLLSSKYSPQLIDLYAPEDKSSHFFLQLRSHGMRQLLLGELGRCSKTVDGRNYLLWTGDLDRDGKPDYLVSFIDSDGPVHLYLSGAAKLGQLVGLAGIHNSPPDAGECDGGEPEME